MSRRKWNNKSKPAKVAVTTSADGGTATPANPQRAPVVTVNPPVVTDPTTLAACPAVAPPPDPCEGELTPDLYHKERALILDLIKANTDQHDKAVLQLTAATLAFSITFVDKVAKNPDPSSLQLLGWGWVALVVSMAAMVLSFLTGQWACAKRLAALDKEYLKQPIGSTRNLWATATTILTHTSSLLFFVGLIVILLFSWVNMPSATKGSVAPPETAPKDVAPEPTPTPSKGSVMPQPDPTPLPGTGHIPPASAPKPPPSPPPIKK